MELSLTKLDKRSAYISFKKEHLCIHIHIWNRIREIVIARLVLTIYLPKPVLSKCWPIFEINLFLICVEIYFFLRKVHNSNTHKTNMEHWGKLVINLKTKLIKWNILLTSIYNFCCLVIIIFFDVARILNRNKE